MKKLLIASAALAMVAGTAQAQSSVTIYGAVGASNNSVERNNKETPAQFQNASQDFLGTTALGIKGTEDLGGGNKAFFALEGDLSMSGTLGSADTTGNNLFNRQSHVGLETKFGTISAGRQNDSIKDLEGLGQVYNLSDNLHMNTLVGDRYAQVYKYATPVWNGLKATYSYSNNAENAATATSTTTTTTTDGAQTLNSYALAYTYQNYSFGAGKGTIVKGGDDDKETTFLGARATFGDLTVGAHYAKNKQGANKLDQTMVSANYKIGAIDLKAHYVTNDQTGSVIGAQSATANGSNDGDGYGLMAVYNFSPRTAAYVGYADFDATDSAVSSKTTTVGLFHKF